MHICLPLIQQFLDTLAGIAKATHIFSGKNSMYLPYFKIEILTLSWRTTLSFEQLGPVCCLLYLPLLWQKLKVIYVS